MITKKDWKYLVYNDGKINEHKVMQELLDYGWLINEVSLVYDNLVGLSKVNYSHETIIKEHEDRYYNKDITNDDISCMLESINDIDDLKKEIKDYFKLDT